MRNYWKITLVLILSCISLVVMGQEYKVNYRNLRLTDIDAKSGCTGSISFVDTTLVYSGGRPSRIDFNFDLDYTADSGSPVNRSETVSFDLSSSTCRSIDGKMLIIPTSECLGGIESLTVEVIRSPVGSFSPGDAEVYCVGETMNLEFEGSGGSNFDWYLSYGSLGRSYIGSTIAPEFPYTLDDEVLSTLIGGAPGGESPYDSDLQYTFGVVVRGCNLSGSRLSIDLSVPGITILPKPPQLTVTPINPRCLGENGRIRISHDISDYADFTDDTFDYTVYIVRPKATAPSCEIELVPGWCIHQDDNAIREPANTVILNSTDLNIPLTTGEYYVVQLEAKYSSIPIEKRPPSCISTSGVFQFEAPTPISATVASKKPPTCAGASDGSVTLNITNGNTTYDYDYNNDGTIDGSWNPTSPSYSISGLSSSETYNIRIEDGCVEGDIIEGVSISSGPALVVVDGGSTGSNCTRGESAGEGTGSITASVDALISATTGEALLDNTYRLQLKKQNGAIFEDFMAKVNSRTNTFDNLPAGKYKVSGTNSLGCTADLSEGIDILDTPTTMDISFTQPVCSDSKPEIGINNIAKSAGVVDFTYLINGSNDDNDDTVNVKSKTAIMRQVPADIYTVTVYDSCQLVKEIYKINETINSPPLGVSLATISDLTIQCFEARDGEKEITFSNGVGPNFRVDVKLGGRDFSGYPKEITTMTHKITGLGRGAYTVTVTDLCGSKLVNDTKTFTVTSQQSSPVALDVALAIERSNGKEITCHGGNDGALYVEISGGDPLVSPEPKDYTISLYRYVSGSGPDVFITSTYKACEPDSRKCFLFDGLFAGEYYVVVTDRFCPDNPFDTELISIRQPDELVVSAAIPSHFTPGGVYSRPGGMFLQCNGDVVDFTPVFSGGSTQYELTLSKPSDGDFSPQTIEVSASGERAFTDLNAGSYELTIVDQVGLADVTEVNRCSYQIPFTLREQPPLSLSLTSYEYDNGANSECFGDHNGFITSTLSGGFPPYDYVLTSVGGSDPQVRANETGITQEFDNLIVGNTPKEYTLTVTDDLNCSIESTIILTPPLPVSFEDTLLSVSRNGYNIPCKGDSAVLRITANGGDQDGWYELFVDGSTDAVGPFRNDTTIHLYAGIHTYHVRDQLDCPDTATPKRIELIETDDALEVLEDLASPLPPHCIGGDDGEIHVSAVGGFSFKNSEYDFFIKGPDDSEFRDSTRGSSVIFDEAANWLDPVEYLVQVRDSNTCIAELPIILEANPNPLTLTFTSDLLIEPSCADGMNGSITVTSTNITPKTESNSIIYRLSGGHLGETIVSEEVSVDPLDVVNTFTFEGLGDFNYQTSPYKIWVEDQYACPDTAFQYVDGLRLIAPDPIYVTIEDWEAPFCVDGENGWGTLGGNGGVGPYQISFDSVNFSEFGLLFDTTQLKAGIYPVYLRDTRFVSTEPTCLASDSLIIRDGFNMDFRGSDITNVSCFNGDDGAIALDLTTSYSGVYDFGYDPSRLETYWIQGTDTLGTSFEQDELSAGIYSLSARYYHLQDTLACVEQQDFGIQGPESVFEIGDFKVNDTQCGDTNNGGLLVSYTGGWAGEAVFYNLYGSTDSTGWFSVTNSPFVVNDVAIGDYTFLLAQSDYECVDQRNFSIEMGSIETQVKAVVNPTCSNGNNGFISISTLVADVEFLMVGSELRSTTGLFEGLVIGDYEIVARDSINLSCQSDTISVSILACDNVSPDLQAQIISISPSTCVDSSNGAVFVSANGGIPPYTYTIDGVLTTTVVSDLSYGQHELVVTDSFFTRDTAIVIIDTLLSIDVEEVTSLVSCNGDCDGTVTLLIEGGSGGYSVDWADGEAGATRVGLCVGDYSYTLTDDLSGVCQYEGQVTISSYNELVVSLIDSLAPTCQYGNNGYLEIGISGGSNSYQVEWNNGTNDSKLNDMVPGDYSVTVTDLILGCAAFGEFSLPDALPIVISDTILVSPTCKGGANGSIRLTIENAFSPLVTWSDGRVGPYIDGLSAGDYTYSIESALGCTQSGVISLEELPSLVVEVVKTDNICFGACEGTISLEISGGTPNYFITWGAGSRSSTLDNLCEGTYTYEVQDNFGCTVSGSVEVLAPDPVEISLVSLGNVTCSGVSDGSIEVSIAGGTGAYTYEWSNGNLISNAISGLSAGTYSLIVSDINGCQSERSFVVSQPSLLFTSGDLLFDPSCAGYSDGEIRLNPRGGTGEYTYLWSNGSTTQDAVDLAAGSYSVVVSDQNGCTFHRPFTLRDPQGLQVINIVSTDPVCFDDENGSIALEVIGGAVPYSYGWNSGETTEDISGVSSGDYAITVMDNEECELTRVITLDNPPIPTVFGIEDYIILCEGGEVTLRPDGEWNSYSWTGPGGALGELNSINVTSEGEYGLTVTDEKECPATISTYVEVSPNALVADFIRISEAVIFEPLVFIDLSLPKPDGVTWVIPDDQGVVINSEDEASVELVFVTPGSYEIGLKAVMENCKSEISKIITIAEEGENSANNGENLRLVGNPVDIDIYPNPTRDRLSLQLSVPSREQLRVQLMDVSKNVVFVENLDGRKDYLVKWDMAQIENGVYIMTIQYKDHVQTKQVLIMR